ncbi:MAG TPA: polynucleotide kinase-phosphatase [Ktedonobacterales bacterium]|nr:polynucleotide kinase-phosphatase [Ktedonobacterales bacterium]
MPYMSEQQQETPTRALTIPDLCLVALIGPTGSGKSTFAARHFNPTEVLSSDTFRGIVGDDPNDQSVTAAAFDALHYVAGLRLGLGRLVVVDATSVKPQDRAALVRTAREHDVLPVAFVLNIDERICVERNKTRPDRQLGQRVVHNHVQQLRRSMRGLQREGFRYVYYLNSPEEVDAVTITRTPLWTDRRSDLGPFDIIGDVHGCYDELLELLAQLGYSIDGEAGMRHPDGRRVIFVGDLVDRGPKVVETVTLARRMVAAGQALCVPGNHDVKLARYLKGKSKKMQINHGLAETIAQIEALSEAERASWRRDYLAFADDLVSHYVLAGGDLAVAHAGMKEAFQGRASGRVRDFALYGETTGETDEFGLPIRYNWAADYRGRAAVVYGHTPVPEADWLNNTINIDTGCVFGGKLTALRWPERELVSVAAHQTYAQPARPLATSDAGTADTIGQATDTLLRIEDVMGKQLVSTRLAGNVIVEENQAAAAIEVMSRFALDPRWLIYLPPTMSPSETSRQPEWLEYPSEAFSYFRGQGVPRVVCEEKHMGSRAVVVLCRDLATAARRFSIADSPAPGACYTRTGRRFFDDDALDTAVITRLSDALTAAGFWERFTTDWVCLDAELLPWSAKAQGLLREQYAPVAAAGEAALAMALASAEEALAQTEGVTALIERLRARQENIARYADAYRRYCWETDGLEGVRLAPFHLLATEGRTYFDRDHLWHMSELAQLAEADPLFLATNYRAVNVLDEAECAEAAAWWEAATGAGSEGMVVKPLDFIVRGSRGLVQPALKTRGREYLRIIYGPDYTEPANLERLRLRGLRSKRALAVREFALGVESLERFIRREPLWRVHQAVFAVLALESEPVDPRL